MARWLTHPLVRDTEVDSARRHTGDSAATKDDTVAAPRSLEEEAKDAWAAGCGQRGNVGSTHRFICLVPSTEPSVVVEQLRAYLRGEEARSLSAAMRRIVPELLGCDEAANEAVWSAAAAIIHHSGLAEEASRIIQVELDGTPAAGVSVGETKIESNKVSPPISTALRRAWRSAQQVWSWMEDKFPSSSDTTALIPRAAFLLCLTPWAFTTAGENSSVRRKSADPLSNDPRDVRITARVASADDLVLDFLLRPCKSHAPLAVQGVDKIADVVLGGCIESPGDAQELNPSDLLRIMELRSARAKARAKGFSLAEQFLDGVGSKRSIEKALSAVAEGLAVGCRRSPDAASSEVSTVIEGFFDSSMYSAGQRFDGTAQLSRVHFLCGIEGCDRRSRLALQKGVKKFLGKCSRLLGRDWKVWGRYTTEGLRRSFLLQALRAVSMNYGGEDHDLLESSQLLSPISRLVDDADPFVAAAAYKEMLALYRAAREETESAYPSYTPFQAAFCRAIRFTLLETSRSLFSCANASSAPRMLDDLTIPLRMDQAGLVVPYFPVGPRLSLSLWVLFPSAAPSVSPSMVPSRKGSEAQRSANPAGGVTSQSYVTTSRCVVRRTPSMSSEILGVFDANVVVEVVPPEPRWARHPLVQEGRQFHVRAPLDGYASAYSATGHSVLHPLGTALRRSARGHDLCGTELGRAPAVHLPAPESSGSGVDGEAPLPSDGANLTPALSSSTRLAGAGEEGTSSRSAEREPRQLSRGVVIPGREPLRDLRASNHIQTTAAAATMGGILLFKGNETLLGQDEAPCSWNRLGVEVTSAGALRYFVGEGGASEAAVASPDGSVFVAKSIDPQAREGGCFDQEPSKETEPRWRHITVVQDELDVSLFLDGRLCGGGTLPRHLMRPARPEYRTVAREVESPHPYPNSRDELFWVRIAGATSVTVRFDPKSRTEPEYDFVRFYRDHTRTQVRITWYILRGTLDFRALNF